MPEFSFVVRGAEISSLEKPDKDKMEVRDQDLERELKIVMPIGGIIRWHTSIAIPIGWLDCNGASLDKVEYSALFGVIGYTYGGSGSNFTLPTISGYIIRY